jgi:hypothetical protein
MVEELSLEAPKNAAITGQFLCNECMFLLCRPENLQLTYFVDPTCVLLPPQQAAALSVGISNLIIAALATRYNKTVPVVRKEVDLSRITEWGRVRRVDGGDTMYASMLLKSFEDRRDPTYVRVRYVSSSIT